MADKLPKGFAIKDRTPPTNAFLFRATHDGSFFNEIVLKRREWEVCSDWTDRITRGLADKEELKEGDYVQVEVRVIRRAEKTKKNGGRRAPATRRKP